MTTAKRCTVRKFDLVAQLLIKRVSGKVKHVPPAFRDRKSPYKMVEVDEALSLIAKQSRAFTTVEHVSIKHPEQLIGRIISRDVVARSPLPPFRASIKDGYAVIAGDGAGTRLVNPRASTAGTRPDEMGIISGVCVRINTGAPLPSGADAVVQVEDTELLEHSESGEEKKIAILVAPSVGQDIREIGSDIAANECILEAGHTLGPIEIGLAAAVGSQTVEVYRKPVVGLLSTGDEIVAAGEPQKLGHIWDSNKTTLLSLFAQQNVDTRDLGIAQDNVDDVFRIIAKGFDDVDVLVTTGGVSMGEKDVLKRVLIEDFDATIHFGRVNLKPGKPTAFATCEWKGSTKLIFALPGNPVSAYVTAFLFVMPVLKWYSSIKTFQDVNIDTLHKTVEAKLMIAEAIRLDDRPEYVRAIVSFESDGICARLLRGSQRSSRLLSVKDANALVILPAKTSALTALRSDCTVKAILF